MTVQPSKKRFFRWDGGNSLFWQVVCAVGSWCYVVALQWNNSGLWYQGDSPTHALNGIFWWDFLRHLPVNPIHFALSYYARYPAISPISYPPVFYLAEASCYHLFKTSPFVAKGLVLAFALFGCFYLMAWLRRWIGPVGGWGATLFLVQPAMIIWSNAVMLNVPCTVLGIAALYHWRRWLENPTSRQIYWSAAYALLATLTYLPTIVVVVIMAGWAVAEKRFIIWRMRRLWGVAAAALAGLLPWILLTSRWGSGYRQVALYQGEHPYWNLTSWIYYMKLIPGMLTIPVIILSLISLLLAIFIKTWCRETGLVLIWFGACYVWFSIFSVKEIRYVLLLIPPTIISCTVGVVEVVQRFPRLSSSYSPRLIVACLLLLVTLNLRAAHRVPVPHVSGFQEVVSYLRQADPNSRVFYDGYYNGLFTYYYRIQDQHFTGGVVRADKLLYSGKISVKFGLVENVSSPEEVLSLLQHEGGSKYLVIERQMSDVIPAELYMRKALSADDIRFVRSFRIDTPRVTDLDLYEFIGALSLPAQYDIRFLGVSKDSVFRIEPIPSE